MPNPVNIHVKTPGADAAKQSLDGIAESSEKLGEKAKVGGKKGADGIDELSNAAEKGRKHTKSLTDELGSYVKRMLGLAAIIAGVTKALNTNSQAMEENARVAAAQQKSLLRLQHLGRFFEENPEARKEVSAFAEYGRRPFEEVTDAWYNLRSKSGNLTKPQQMGIMKEALELGRTDPGTQLDTLVDMFSLYAKKTGETDINRAQNVLMKTIEVAGGSTGDVAGQMPLFLPVGMAGGLTGPQAAGLWSYATTQTSDAAIATTGLRATFMGLQGEGTPEGKKMLEGLGVTDQMDFFQKYNILSQQKAEGKFSLANAQKIAGQEGAALLLDLLKDPQAMYQTIGAVTAADRGDIDIVRQSIDDLNKSDPVAQMEEDIRRLNIAIENEKGSGVDALKHEQIQLKHKLASMKQKIAPYFYETWGVIAKALAGMGVSPETVEDIIFKDGPPAGSVTNPNIIDLLTMKALVDLGVKPREPSTPKTTVINNVNYNNDTHYHRPEGTAQPRFGPDRK